MKLTQGNLYDAAMALKGIVEGQPRDLPQTAQYRLAKMFGKIKRYGLSVEKGMIEAAAEIGEERKGTAGESLGWHISEAKRAEYDKMVGDLRAIEVEVDVQPLTFGAFGESTNGLTAQEFYMLGDLITGEPLITIKASDTGTAIQ